MRRRGITKGKRGGARMKTKTKPNGGMRRGRRLPVGGRVGLSRRMARVAAKGKRRRQHLYKDAQRLTGLSAEEMKNTDPVEAMQHVLDTAFGHLLFAGKQVGELDEDELWHTYFGEKVPNEWLVLEARLRQEVLDITARMMHLGIEDRRARVAEVLAITMAPVLEQMIRELRLTPAQRARAPQIIGTALKQLESGE